jgi:SAM-dependent methyltransferase
VRPADGTPVGLRNRRSLGIAVNALNRWNARHPWSHNDHFHGWILRNLPVRRSAALDAGCGRGALVEKLADHFEQVTGVDPDAEMAAVARERLAGLPGVEVRQQSLLDTTGRYDLVTMVASLHHLPLEPALRHTAELVAPGGRLLVVGLAQLGSPADLALDSASLLLNPLVGFVKHPRAAPAPTTAVPGVPIRDPEEDFAEVRSVAERVLPGSRMRRRLFFRYTLRWDAHS